MPVEMVKSVEKCYILINTGATKATYTLTKGQNTANCVPFASWERGNNQSGFDNWDEMVVDVYFESGNKVAAERNTGAASVAVAVSVYVVEFEPSEVKVQQGTWSISSGATTGNATVTAVDQTYAAAIAYFKTTYADKYPDNHSPMYYFTSDTNLRFERRSTPPGVVSGHYYIFEALDSQWTVQAVASSRVNTNQLNLTISPVVMDRTFIICSFHADAASGYASYGSPRFALTSTTNVRMQTNNSDDKQFRAFIVECADDAIFVQRYTGLNIDNSPSQNVTQALGTSVNLDKAIISLGSALSTSQGTGTSPWYYVWGRATLTNASTARVDIYKAHTYHNYFNIEVIEFPTTELYCEGTVRVDGVLTSGIDVNLFLRETDELLGSDTTTAGGVFEIPSRHQAYHYLVAKATESGTNSVVLDWLYPTVS